MNPLKQLFANDNAVFLLCSLIMSLYQIILWKKKKFYNFSEEMRSHPLNQKYHLNQRCSADLERINRLLCLSNVSAILISCIIVFAVGFQAGIIALAVLFLVFNFATTTYIGKTYG